MADHPLRPATDRRLGRLLPYQLANRTRAHLIARACKQRPPFSRKTYAVLARVSPGCPPLRGRFPRVTHPSATLLATEVTFAFDLHVLGMPPAFNLSQDQTLQFILLGCRNNLSLLNGYLQSLEDAPSISFKPFRLRRSTHTSYPNELLKNSALPLREDRPFYPLQRRCQAGVSSASNSQCECELLLFAN